jgi:transcriptional regulator with XRE-family HTH domain
MKKKTFLIDLGNNIRRIREEKGLSLFKLGKITKKDYRSIMKVEQGKINCTLFYLCELADGLGIEVSEIVKSLP